ncbi:FtsX-like permease family protein [Taibaiella sp. KBW10]|uniref:FtsX-like permease family protein n=1 Tax=Taibaiella sp. KBW10 TaxID=2153357 RepID=UPI0013155356|nr:FtsX-like permease family protein [Taibaiella sp. KBW10]
MNIPFRIALRYFKGKKSAQAINIVTWISIGAIALSATAMIVLFSVYNGLEQYVKSMYTSFYPEVKITATHGKFFPLTDKQKQQIRLVKGVKGASYATEDMALLDGTDHQKVISLKGVDNEWFRVNTMESHITTGTASWPEQSRDIPSNIGVDIVAEMGIDVSNPFNKIQIFYPKADGNISGMPTDAAINSLEVAPYSSFNVQPELDGLYFLVPVAAAQQLFGVGNQYSSVELSLQSAKAESQVIADLKKLLGSEFKVQSRLEQNATLYMVTKTEKWAIYGILLLVLIISSFNMVGSLSMLAIEKKIDVAILKSLGATQQHIYTIFLWVGLILSFIGAVIGMLLGLIIALVQIKFGIIAMGDGFLEAYPVALKWNDFALVLLTVLFVGFLAALYPARKAAKQLMIFRDE